MSRYKEVQLGILDTETNLIWQNKTHNKCTWEKAKLLEIDGWRLPTIDELRTLVNKERENPSIDPIFSDTKSAYYWSASPYANHSDGAWYVGFDYGYEYTGYKNGGNYVRLVRGGQPVLIKESIFMKYFKVEVYMDGGNYSTFILPCGSAEIVEKLVGAAYFAYEVKVTEIKVN